MLALLFYLMQLLLLGLDGLLGPLGLRLSSHPLLCQLLLNLHPSTHGNLSKRVHDKVTRKCVYVLRPAAGFVLTKACGKGLWQGLVATLLIVDCCALDRGWMNICYATLLTCSVKLHLQISKGSDYMLASWACKAAQVLLTRLSTWMMAISSMQAGSRQQLLNKSDIGWTAAT